MLPLEPLDRLLPESEDRLLLESEEREVVEDRPASEDRDDVELRLSAEREVEAEELVLDPEEDRSLLVRPDVVRSSELAREEATAAGVGSGSRVSA